MVKLDKGIEEKVLRIVKPFHDEENYELNYVITDDKITFFSSINESKKLNLDAIEQIASAIDGSFEGIQLINQEYRFTFNLNPCGQD